MRLGFRVGIRLLVSAICKQVYAAQQKSIESSSALPGIGHALPELLRIVKRIAVGAIISADDFLNPRTQVYVSAN